MLCTENLRNEPTTTSTIVFRISRKNVTFRQIVFTAPLSPYPVWEGLCVFAREHFIFFLYFIHSFIRKHAHKLSIFHLSLSVLPLSLMQDFSAHKYMSRYSNYACQWLCHAYLYEKVFIEWLCYDDAVDCELWL